MWTPFSRQPLLCGFALKEVQSHVAPLHPSNGPPNERQAKAKVKSGREGRPQWKILIQIHHREHSYHSRLQIHLNSYVQTIYLS
jgi:hypothetical protein